MHQFADRGLSLPGDDRMTRLMREIEGGRSLDDIGAGLDAYQTNQGQGQSQPVNTAADNPFPTQDQLAALTEEQIEAALTEIEARYGLTRAELEADESAAGRAFRLLETQLGRRREQQLEAAESSALQRGLFNSGIYGEDVAETQRAYAESLAMGEQQRQAKLSAIQNALSQLEAQTEAEKAATAAQIRREELQAAASRYGG